MSVRWLPVHRASTRRLGCCFAFVGSAGLVSVHVNQTMTIVEWWNLETLDVYRYFVQAGTCGT